MASWKLVIITGALCALLNMAESLETTVITCPDPCTCTHDPGKFTVDCRRKGLAQTPDLSSLKNQTIFRLLLGSNRIKSLENNTFHGYHIEGIDLSFNLLTSITPDAMGGLEDTLTFLSLRGTKLTSWPKEALKRLASLTALDMSDIFAGKPTPLDADTFASNVKLQELILSNNGLTTVDKETFAGLGSLLVLVLNENKLTDLSGMFQAPSLQEISLIANKLSTLSSTSFSGLSHLRYLKMSDNAFKNTSALPKDAFDPIRSSLEWLDLDFNELGGVPDLGALPKLEELKLDGTMITSVKSGAFAGMSSLTTLDISDNTLEISEGMFTGLENTLKVLKMVRTDLLTVPINAIKKLNNLEELHLSGNMIESLPNLGELTVTTYDLENNQIASIAGEAFDGIDIPVNLKLGYNKLTNLTFISDACKFSRLELSGNDVLCDCGVFNLLRTVGPEVLGRCASPDDVKGLSMTSSVFKEKMAPKCGNMSMEAIETCMYSSGAQIIMINTAFLILLALVPAIKLLV